MNPLEETRMYILAQLFWLGTGTSIKSGGVKLVLHTQTTLLIEMMLTCKCISRVNKMPMLSYDWVVPVFVKTAT